MSGISEAERHQFHQIFLSINPIDGYITGDQARTWLLNSGLSLDRLERVWDLCDIDKDGRLDFDEFAVTCRLVNDLLRNVFPDVPQQLPPHLIPPSKMQIVGRTNYGVAPQMTYNTGASSLYGQQQLIAPIMTGVGVMQQQPYQPQAPPPVPPPPPLPQQIVPPPPPPLPPQRTGYSAFPQAPLTDDFDWYMPPADKFNYENEYSKKCGSHGLVRFSQFEELIQQLGVPREECVAAWNLVDVNFEQLIGKDACLVFLHILNQRSQGRRIPSQMPPVLRTSLMRGKLNYNYNETIDPSLQSRTDGSTRMSVKREEEQLLKELEELEEKIRKAEQKAISPHTRALSSGSSVQGQLRQLYDFKQRQLNGLRDAERNNVTLDDLMRRERSCIRELQDDLRELRDQVTQLEALNDAGQTDLRRFERDIENARAVR